MADQIIAGENAPNARGRDDSEEDPPGAPECTPAQAKESEAETRKIPDTKSAPVAPEERDSPSPEKPSPERATPEDPDRASGESTEPASGKESEEGTVGADERQQVSPDGREVADAAARELQDAAKSDPFGLPQLLRVAHSGPPSRLTPGRATVAIMNRCCPRRLAGPLAADSTRALSLRTERLHGCPEMAKRLRDRL